MYVCMSGRMMPTRPWRLKYIVLIAQGFWITHWVQETYVRLDASSLHESLCASMNGLSHPRMCLCRMWFTARDINKSLELSIVVLKNKDKATHLKVYASTKTIFLGLFICWLLSNHEIKPAEITLLPPWQGRTARDGGGSWLNLVHITCQQGRTEKVAKVGMGNSNFDRGVHRRIRKG